MIRDSTLKIRPPSCGPQPWIQHLFRDDQEGEHVPVFQHLCDLHATAADAQSPLFFYFLLESHVHQCNCPPTSHCVCGRSLSHDTQLVKRKTYHHFQASVESSVSLSCFPVALNLLLPCFCKRNNCLELQRSCLVLLWWIYGLVAELAQDIL